MTASITDKEVVAHIKKLGQQKATGPDKLAGDLLQYLPTTGVKWLTEMYNSILTHRKVPEQWKKANIFLIHKGEAKNKCVNFQPIALTDATYQLFMTIINTRINLVTQNLIST